VALTVATGDTEWAEFTADAQGTYFYWGAVSGSSGLARRLGFDSQLNGAFIVDPPAPTPVPEDRIFLISLWNDSTHADGRIRFDREFWAINGAGWPETERLEATVGDSIRWRVINASADVHPMHLHGFYFRVDALGAPGRDVIYEPTQRRMAVTERLTPGMTMQLVWSPDRAGGWIFHCHMTVHLLPQPQLAGQHGRSEAHDPDRHLEDSMSGLILAIEVHPGPRRTEAGAERARRFLRLFIHSDSAAADSAGRRFTAVLQRGTAEPASDSVPAMGSPLVLERGEPTSIMVINRTGEPTSIHWHGLELESFFDGVVGLGGMPGMRTPPVMPTDSFEVRITPPRAGTFMYHTHMDDVRQQSGGLYGSFLVYEPGARTDPARDIPLMIANDASGGVVIDGSRVPDTLRVRVGVTIRLRIANITVANPMLVMRLVQGGEPVTWRHVATDGFERPAGSVAPTPAALPVSNGEIRDVEFTADRVGDLTFEVRAGDGRLLVSRVLHAAP
jgi:FtsP/CotA-like multicopper oxidase with cupredoxin domain